MSRVESHAYITFLKSSVLLFHAIYFLHLSENIEFLFLEKSNYPTHLIVWVRAPSWLSFFNQFFCSNNYNRQDYIIQN